MIRRALGAAVLGVLLILAASAAFSAVVLPAYLPAVPGAVASARAMGFVFGMLTGVMVLQIAAYALTLEASIPWYLAFCVSVAAIEALKEGLLPKIGPPGVTLTVLDLLNGIADTGFVLVFLRLWSQSRRLFSVAVAAIAVLIVAGIALAALPALQPVQSPLRTILLLAGFLTLMGVTIARGVEGYRPAWWLPPALVMLFFQVGYTIVKARFGLRSAFLDAWAFEIGTIGDTFLFALAVLARARYVVLERRAIARQLDEVTHAALHDALTGTLNRRGLFARMASNEEPGTVFYVDLDNFKMINDRYGHATGDAVLVQVAKAIRTAIVDGDTVARIGGDEFVVVTRDASRKAADTLAFRLALDVAKIGPEDALPAQKFGASIGYVDFDGIHFDSALRRADAEAYRIKAEKRARIRLDR